MTLRTLLSGLAQLAANDLALVVDALALIRLRGTPLAHVSGNLADLLLVDALDHDLRGGGHLEGDAVDRLDDDGMGMSQEDVARFNKEQDLAPNAGTNNEHGNGIGLAICRDLVRNNGGSIVVEPGRLCGTSVTVLLNLADAGNK